MYKQTTHCMATGKKGRYSKKGKKHCFAETLRRDISAENTFLRTFFRFAYTKKSHSVVKNRTIKQISRHR